MTLTEKPIFTHRVKARGHAFRDHAQPFDRTTIDRFVGAKLFNESMILFQRKTISSESWLSIRRKQLGNYMLTAPASFATLPQE
jgi:hypothetical protein